MLNQETLVNIAIFLERVPVTGKEAYAWAETHTAVVNSIKAFEALKAARQGESK